MPVLSPPPIQPLLHFLNHLLQQEQWALQQLTARSGAMIGWAVSDWEWSWQTRITDAGLFEQITPDPAHPADVTLSLSSQAIIKALPTLSNGWSSLRQTVQVHGDADLAATLANVLQNLRWDVEHDLSRWLGDIAAHRLHQQARMTLTQLQTTGARVRDNVLEFLTEEQPLLVTQAVFSVPRSQLHNLRDTLARLEKRIAMLENTVAQSSSQPS